MKSIVNLYKNELPTTSPARHRPERQAARRIDPTAYKYMVKQRGPPSQGWRTFLHNHAPDIAAMDLFVVPTIGFKLLYAFVILWLDRRDLVWINITAHPTVDWVARQITEAFLCVPKTLYGGGC